MTFEASGDQQVAALYLSFALLQMNFLLNTAALIAALCTVTVERLIVPAFQILQALIDSQLNGTGNSDAVVTSTVLTPVKPSVNKQAPSTAPINKPVASTKSAPKTRRATRSRRSTAVAVPALA